MDRERFHQARSAKLQIDESRREKHARIAAMLRDPRQAPSVVKAGLKQVDLWRAHKLCSQDYIESWIYLLAHPLLAAKTLEDRAPKSVQLRQNSPFAALIRD